MEKRTDRETNRQRDRQMDTRTGRQTDRHTDIFSPIDFSFFQAIDENFFEFYPSGSK